MNHPVTKILIITDREEEQTRLDRLFQDRLLNHYEVTQVSQGQDGLKMVHDQGSSPFESVLLREQLSDQNASDVLCRSIDDAIERDVLSSRYEHGLEKLKQSDSKCRSILERAAEAIVLLDQHGTMQVA